MSAASDSSEAQPHPAQQLNRIVFRPWDAQILSAAVRFDLAGRLSGGPRTAADLAAEIEADPGSFGRFLGACATLGVVQRDADGRYALTAVGEYLRTGDGGLGNVILMNTTPGIWNRAARLHESVLTGRMVLDEAGENLYEYYGHHPQERSWHAAAMADLSIDAGEVIAEHYDLSAYSTIVDVGGSWGVLLSRVLRAAPHAKGMVFDLPGIVEGGREATAGSDVADRLSFVEGSFFADAPPAGDLYIIKQVLCDWGDEDVARILASCYRGAPPGSRLVVIDWVRPSGPEPSDVDSMSVGLQVVTGGRVRTEEEFVGLIEGAGFRFDSTVTLPSRVIPRPWYLLQAYRP
ncbi:methyltransferase [Actinoallomurus sp. NPDC052274]|uniref:methyltransferase n=1 Tax=Actinoallomurus sp. NPDC052274 TaxID=3155420 RepID=UPI00343AB469